jgi:hypothetical protein
MHVDQKKRGRCGDGDEVHGGVRDRF